MAHQGSPPVHSIPVDALTNYNLADSGGAMTFLQQYGPWAIIAGASEGVGQHFAEVLAERGLNLVLVARRQSPLDSLAADLQQRFGIETRAVTMDLSAPDASARLLAQLEDIDVGLLVYCAGADANYRGFLDAPLTEAESMVQRNCLVPMQLCHHLGRSMADRGRGGIILFGSGAGLAGARNMVAYGASKAFDMVFAEALWCELKPLGVNVLGLMLGETDTPALRRLRFQRGLSKSPNQPVKGAESVDYVVRDALANLGKGPTRLANRKMRLGLRLLFPLSRNTLVAIMAKGNEKVMGK